MRKRSFLQFAEPDACSLLQQIEDKIRASEIDIRHRDVLIRLRSMIEEDLANTLSNTGGARRHSKRRRRPSRLLGALSA